MGFDPKRNNTELATAIIAEFEEMRDLYAILDLDEHCTGGVHMVGQVHIVRRWKRGYKDEYGGTNVSLWLALSEGYKTYELSIKDAVRLTGRECQDIGVSDLIHRHLDEIFQTGRWNKEMLPPVEIFDTESGWIRFLEDGGLVVIKQTL